MKLLKVKNFTTIDHLCSLRNFSRRADFKNLPTEVLGIASMMW
jgi:hypothetical protein